MVKPMEKPAILIGVPDATSQVPAALQPLLNRIEEEAIPVQTKVIVEDDVVARAYQAALASRLSVGIGFAGQQVVVHYKNLRPTQPLFSVMTTSNDQLRRLGANAARLVKGVPFKKIDD
ncbi:glycerol dehydratase reactivase beta/small subunit family protein [Levilactobacillus brevis]|uniref:Glycerol dehydratase reactivase beta/small subunit family protein n=1 Tax=Levilactobacillus hammesii TaxID=267633 RepID=A0A921EYQ3_9LACO|nr:glycerol dehydratase reactivase beta/small subunit family protein [Levilactobacillus brevis]HJE86557.1 glycerol dehydratase reactivase beta/small subunit family protein [Levilactobacillus hammesii]